MKLIKCISLLLTIMFIVGCSNVFDESMTQGREALNNNEYDAAITAFNKALIEHPTDETAQLLLEKATSEKIKAKEIETFKEYHEKMKNNVRLFIETKNTENNEVLASLDGRNSEMDSLQKIKMDISSDYMFYQNNNVISEMHINLSESIEEAITALAALNVILNHIDDAEKNNENVNEKLYYEFNEIFEQANEKSNELLAKYVTTIKDYRETNNIE